MIGLLLRLDRVLHGQPDHVLAAILLLLALGIAAAAILAPPLLKAALIAWIVLP